MIDRTPIFDEGETTAPPPPCDHPGCAYEGVYLAPKSPHNLRDYYHFCLDHIREYNKKWDFFAGFSQEQIYRQLREDTAWDRPTWPVTDTIKIEEKLHDFLNAFTKGASSGNMPPPYKKPLTREAQAFETLGLSPNDDMKIVKTRYRELVKRYHPDKNPDNPKAAERFKVISEAYAILRMSFQGTR